MPIEAKPEMMESRRRTTYLEDFARLIAGLAPWLELESAAEGALRARYRSLVVQGLAQALDAQGPDAFFWDADNQNVVDGGFLALAVLRAPRVLNHELERALRQRLIAALTATRKLDVAFSNWLLFAACVEAAVSNWARQIMRCATPSGRPAEAAQRTQAITMEAARDVE